MGTNQSFLENLEWRRAVKHFGEGEVDSSAVLRAMINAPSSFGLQPYKVVAVRNKDIKTIVYDKFNIPMNPTHIDYGISCINKNNFIKYSKNKPKNFDLAQYLNYLSKKKMLYFIETKKKFYEVGSFQGIKNFKNFINKNDL